MEQRLIFDRPGYYRIRAAGWMDESWSTLLGGLAITTAVDTNGAYVTTLAGLLLDQAALVGVLATLRELDFLLLSVERIQDD